MKKLIPAMILNIMLSQLLFAISYDELFEKIDSCYDMANPPKNFDMKIRNGLLPKSEISICSGGEDITVTIPYEHNMDRIVSYKNKNFTINANRFKLNKFNNFYGMYIPDFNISLGLSNYHLQYYERCINFSNIDKFKEFLELDKIYKKKSGSLYVESYDKKGLMCSIEVVKGLNITHISVFITQILINWKIPDSLPASPNPQNFEITYK